MYKLVFYVPINDAENVKKSVFLTGAGQIGNYSNCAWETEGFGQFKPLSGSNPTIGKLDCVEKVPELRVEILCESKNIKEAIKALKDSHPYEEPAYEVFAVLNQEFE